MSGDWGAGLQTDVPLNPPGETPRLYGSPESFRGRRYFFEVVRCPSQAKSLLFGE